jgi:hypothetical protein
MTFDDQYQNGSFNSNTATGENFSRNASTYLDINLGTFLHYTFKQRAYVQYGLSYMHFNSPKLSFQNNTNIKIDPKLTNFIHMNYPLASQIDIAAEIIIATQGKYKEIIPGALIKYNIEPNTNQTIAAGFYYRLKDAAIARLGYNYKTTTVGISYDINTSKFIAATNRRGAFEIYITHIFRKVIPFVPKTKVCPVFM